MDANFTTSEEPQLLLDAVDLQHDFTRLLLEMKHHDPTILSLL